MNLILFITRQLFLQVICGEGSSRISGNWNYDIIIILLVFFSAFPFHQSTVSMIYQIAINLSSLPSSLSSWSCSAWTNYEFWWTAQLGVGVHFTFNHVKICRHINIHKLVLEIITPPILNCQKCLLACILWIILKQQVNLSLKLDLTDNDKSMPRSSSTLSVCNMTVSWKSKSCTYYSARNRVEFLVKIEHAWKLIKLLLIRYGT